MIYGVQPRVHIVMVCAALVIMDLTAGSGRRFSVHTSKINHKIMSNVFEKQANGLIMVTTDQSVFPVEVKGGNVAVNLTAMAKPFGKRTRDWFRTEETRGIAKRRPRFTG